jgi:cation:H+ antiporter
VHNSCCHLTLFLLKGITVPIIKLWAKWFRQGLEMLLFGSLLILSLIILYFGAEFALEASEKVGLYFGLSHLTIGLLIVGFGTSLPEFFVSHISSFRGHYSLALGNVLGSNVANLFLIMGLAGVLVPLGLKAAEIRTQLGLHLGLTVLLAWALSGGKYDWTRGLPLGIFFLVYLHRIWVQMKRTRAMANEEEKNHEKLPIKTWMELLVGFVFLYGGGELLVYSGSHLGKQMGISEFVLSAIVVAFGTSLPELITAILACYKKKDVNLITGNVIGSNIFNVSFVLSGIAPYGFYLEGSYFVELGVLLCAGVFLLLMSLFKFDFKRASGVLFLAGYLGMVTYWIRHITD